MTTMDHSHTTTATSSMDQNIHHHPHHVHGYGHGHGHGGGYNNNNNNSNHQGDGSSTVDGSNDTGSDTIRDSVLNHSPINASRSRSPGSAAMSSSPVPMMTTMIMPQLPQHIHTTSAAAAAAAGSSKTRKVGNGGSSSSKAVEARKLSPNPLSAQPPHPPVPPRPYSQQQHQHQQQHLSTLTTIEALRKVRRQRLASAAATRPAPASESAPVASVASSGAASSSDDPAAASPPLGVVPGPMTKPHTVAASVTKTPPQKDRSYDSSAGSGYAAISTTSTSNRSPVVVSPVVLKPRVRSSSIDNDGANHEIHHQVPQRYHYDQETNMHQTQSQQHQHQHQHHDDDDDDAWNDPWIKSMTSDVQHSPSRHGGSLRQHHHMFLDDGFPPVSDSAALWEDDEAPTSNFFDVATTTATTKRTLAVSSTPPRQQQQQQHQLALPPAAVTTATANVVTPTHSSNFTASTNTDSNNNNNNTSYSSFSQNQSINTSMDSAFLPFSVTQKVVVNNSKSEVVRPQARHLHPNHGNQVWTTPRQSNHNRTGSMSDSIQSAQDFILKSSEGSGNSNENSNNKMIEEHKSSLTPPLHLSSPIPPDAFSSYYQDNVYRSEGVASPATALSVDPFNVAFSKGSDTMGDQNPTRDGKRNRKEDMRKDADDEVDPVKTKAPDHNNADMSVSRSMSLNNKKDYETSYQTGSRSTHRNVSVSNIRLQIKTKKKIGSTAPPPPPPKHCRKVQVVIKERLSILFADETSVSSTQTGAQAKNDTGAGKGGSKDGPVCRVVGSVYVRPLDHSPEKTKAFSPGSFYLTVRDEKSHIEQWDDQRETERCRNVTAGTSHSALGPNDQVFKVSLDASSSSSSPNDQDLPPIMSYTCIPRLRPMPMLVKTKVHRKESTCRVGIRIRANPQNTYVLTDAVVLMVVPFDMDGESVTMSRDGAVWDAMKRTLAWPISKLTAGETIDIQAQFKCLPEPIEGSYLDDLGTNTPNGGSFPVLASCNGNTTFSKIDVNTDYSSEDGSSSPVELEIKRSSTVLYRKTS